MKNFFLRLENLLLIIPAVLLTIERIFFKAVFDLHLHDTYFVIAGFHIWIGILIILLLPYLCHLLLRLNYKRNKKILVTHVVLTIILVLFLFIGVKQNPGVTQHYYDFSSWENARQFGGLNYYLPAAFLTFLSIQLLFMFYTLLRLIVKKQVYQ